MIPRIPPPALAPLWMIVPFLLQVMAIAIIPFFSFSWWKKNYATISVSLSLITLFYYLFILQNKAHLMKALQEYTIFITLVGSLFVVVGGIHISFNRRSTPLWNVLFLLCGSLLANFIGTTGASILLIRPWIKINEGRFAPYHLAFFIFTISNSAGSLTPIADPPLFLGFVYGVPILWTLLHCWQPWIFVLGLLILIFYFFDRWHFRPALHASQKNEGLTPAFQIEGLRNLLFLFLILGSIFLPTPWQILTMLVATTLSWVLTAPAIHKKNDFTFEPIREVAYLFLGLFITMIPLLDNLEHLSQKIISSFTMTSCSFYYLTGFLSTCLDNALTYSSSFALFMGHHGKSLHDESSVLYVSMNYAKHLMAISMGAVFFGGMTYIGNAPNLMVLSIVQEAGIKTLGFFAYILRYALPILLPILVAVELLFMR